NSATNGAGQGGGVHNVGTLALTNCTFSGNSAQSKGGAIQNDSLSISLQIHSSTFSDNAAPAGSGLLNDGNVPFFAGTIGLKNSIVAGNLGGADIHNLGTINSGGHNLIGTTTGDSISPRAGD